MEAKNFTILSLQSSINWKRKTGRMVIGSHKGTIAIKEGSLVFINGKLEAGKFIIDTTSANITDMITPAANTPFAAQSADDDLFSSKKFPEAIFEIISVFPKTDDVNYVEGNLTIKKITRFVSFDANLNVDGDILHATARLAVDRKKFKMKFYSGSLLSYIKDTLSNHIIELEIDLFAWAL